MHLWVILTGAIGESYVRAYAWCATEADARQMFTRRHPLHIIRKVQHVFAADDLPFVTPLSDSGILDEEL